MHVSWRLALVLAAGGGLALLLFAWSGIYNVAASRGHWAIVDWALRFGMKNSVQTQAPDVVPPPLDDPDRIILGAAHFHAGCAFCHGAPDTPASPITQAMLPSPPDLRGRLHEWSDQELFWIVRHGIKYAGMPAWPGFGHDDEVWSVVAFLRRLPELDGAGYRALGGTTATDAIGACARCHGMAGEGPPSALVPRLHGQPAAMIAQALEDYAAGRRRSGIMQPAASGLSPRAVTDLAAYYAALAPLPPAQASPAGARLAAEGDAAAGIPPCLSCHDRAALAQYPRLAGQNARYLATRLRNWQQGIPLTPGEVIMQPIARKLDEAQIDALAAYFAGAAP